MTGRTPDPSRPEGEARRHEAVDIHRHDATAPPHVVVMGVSGTGKSTVGRAVSDELGVPLVEGDRYHPQSNIEKMASGIPLTDADRRSWLETLARIVAEKHTADERTVLACSALRRSYRDVLRGPLAPGGMFFVHLHAPYDVLEARMAGRDHFMPSSLLRSQFDTLEPLQPDEAGVLIDVSPPVEEVLDKVRAALRSTRA